MSKNRDKDNFWDNHRDHSDWDAFSPNPLRRDSRKSDYSIKNVREDNLRIDKRKRRIPKRSSTPFKPREIPKPLAVRQKDKREIQQKRIILQDKIKANLKIDEDSLLLFEEFSDLSLEEENPKEKRPALSRSLKKIMESETKASRRVKDKQLSSLFTSTILNKNKTE